MLNLMPFIFCLKWENLELQSWKSFIRQLFTQFFQRTFLLIFF
jgi:hypothetical protein